MSDLIGKPLPSLKDIGEVLVSTHFNPRPIDPQTKEKIVKEFSESTNDRAFTKNLVSGKEETCKTE